MLQLGNDENVKQLLLKMPKFYHYLINNCKKIVHVLQILIDFKLYTSAVTILSVV